ncbi:hypothetical protein [Candidatus Amarobacter glycogenicus]
MAGSIHPGGRCSEAEALAYAERVSVDNRSHVPVRQAFVYRE